MIVLPTELPLLAMLQKMRMRHFLKKIFVAAIFLSDAQNFIFSTLKVDAIKLFSAPSLRLQQNKIERLPLAMFSGKQCRALLE